MNNIDDKLSFWRNKFGLLPIDLFSKDSEGSYIMRNGGSGDFCLGTNQIVENTCDYNSFAWSSNTKNFVVVNEDEVKLFNWKKNKTENISRKQVEDNADKFYKYLLSLNYKSENDVVPFIVDIFKQVRNITQEKNNAVQALNLLFLLLISLKEDINTIDFQKWNLDEITIPNNFDAYTSRLNQGFSGIKPELDLIIRHSSGFLFQEAQKEILYFDGQLDVWGLLSSKSDAKRPNYSSIHYTPPYLARSIVENAIRDVDLDKPLLKIFDPACGSSEFLIEALKQLKQANYLGEVQIIGWDSSETAIITSKFLLKYEKNNVWHERMSFDIKLVEDSLQEKWGDDYDLILMNPPFVSWEQMDKAQRESVRESLSSSLKGKGKPNQASAFFYKSIQSLGEKGVIGCVIPSSLLLLDAYTEMRNEAHNLISIKLIGKLGNFIFEDVLTDASLIIGCKPKENTIPLLVWTRNEDGIAQQALRDLRKMYYFKSPKVEEQDYCIYKPDYFPTTKENWKITSFQENKLFKTIERFTDDGRLVRVRDIFVVHQGIRMGNPVFKISKLEYDNLPKNEKKYFRPAIDNEAIKEGQILTENFVWYPYNSNGIIIHTEAELKSKVPSFYETKLVQLKDKLAARARFNDSKWWHLSEHRAWLRTSEKRLVSTEFGRSNSFAFDKDGIYAVERGNAWSPKKTNDFEDINFYYFYLSIFSSPFFDKLLSIYSKQLLSGWDLGQKYTQNIPIPNVSSEEVRDSTAYVQLVEIGKELSNNYYLRNMIDSILLKYIYPIS